MLMQEPTPGLYAQWRQVWSRYRPRLVPNRKNGAALQEYLLQKYPLLPRRDAAALRVITGNILHNAPHVNRLPTGSRPQPVAYQVENTGAGRQLYDQQDPDFRGTPIFVGLDLTSGFFCVEASSLLWDELYAFRGLDDQDLQNPFSVAEYISCLQRFGQLQQTLTGCSRAAATA